MAAEQEEQQVAAAAPDEASDEEECGEECSTASESGDSTEGESEGAVGGGKSKKKKKKKRKGGGGAAGGGGAQPPVDPEARKEGDRRFQAAVELLAHNSEDSMWVKLGGCHLADGKLKKLCEALRANTTVISLDLSANHFTDEGAKALAAALRDGRAPDLIDLDLKDNPQIKEEGTAALEELQQQRKTLRVALGPSAPPPPPQQQQQQQPGSPKGRGPGQPGSPKGQQQQQGGGVAGEQHAGAAAANGSMADSVKNNPVISKYFSVGNDEADDAEEEEEEQPQQQAPQQQQQQQQQSGGGGGGEEQEQQSFGGLTEAELAHILWDQLEQCLNAATPDIPAVSEPLRAIAEQVEHEMDNSTLPLPPTIEMGELRTFTQWALRKLHVLHSVLDLVPAPILTPYSKQTPVPAVGTHRAAVAELLAQLLRAEAPEVAQMVAASGVLRRCAKIAIAHPNCSAIHGAVARCLKLSLSKPVGQVGLWHQLLGSAPLDAHGGAIGEDHGSSLNLAVEAAAIAKAALAAPTIGKRASNVGFALAIGQLLHAAATGEQLGAAKRAAAEAAAAAGSDASPAGSSPPPEQQQQGGGSSSGSEGEGQGEERAQQGASPPGSSASPLAQEDNPLKEKPMPPGFGLRRISSSSLIPRAASAAVSDMPDDKESWAQQLQVQLSTEEWVDFSLGPDCLLRTLLAEHEGDLGGPRPRPGGDPEPDSGDEDVSPGQIIRCALCKFCELTGLCMVNSEPGSSGRTRAPAQTSGAVFQKHLLPVYLRAR